MSEADTLALLSMSTEVSFVVRHIESTKWPTL